VAPVTTTGEVASGSGVAYRAGHRTAVHEAVILPGEGVVAGSAREEGGQVLEWHGVAGFAVGLQVSDLGFQPAGEGVADAALANVSMSNGWVVAGLAIRRGQVDEEGVLPGIGAVAVGANAGVMVGRAVVGMAGQAGGVGGVIDLQVLPVFDIVMAVGAGAGVVFHMLGVFVAAVAGAHAQAVLQEQLALFKGLIGAVAVLAGFLVVGKGPFGPILGILVAQRAIAGVMGLLCFGSADLIPVDVEETFGFFGHFLFRGIVRVAGEA